MRSYKKSHLEKPALEQKQPGSDASINTSTVTVKDAGKNYRKEDGIKSPKSFFVIVSGGEVREKNYFSVISKSDKFERIKLEFVADPKLLNPDGLLETAKYKQKHYQMSQEEDPDKIFIVSDVDHFYNDLLRIKPQCEDLDICLIISNSCFEIWLYYGKFSISPIDFNIPQNSSKISQAFKTYLGQKVKGGINPNKAIFDINNAIVNAKSVYQEDINEIPDLFSTNMFLLAEEILPFIDSEIKQIIGEKIQQDAKYKKALDSEVNQKNKIIQSQ